MKLYPICPLAISALLGMAPSSAVSGATAGRPLGMFAVYEENRNQGIPNYITEDFLLLSYSMLVENAVTKSEESECYGQLQKLVSLLRTRIAAKAKPGEADLANLDFLAVADALL